MAPRATTRRSHCGWKVDGVIDVAEVSGKSRNLLTQLDARATEKEPKQFISSWYSYHRGMIADIPSLVVT
jgi:hypothetical protein